MARVFISHSSEDRDVIDREIRPLLESHGLSTWCSGHDIPGAARFEVDIRRGLRESEWFLLVMSSSSSKSRWVEREVHWAMEERHDRFVPVLVEPCDFNEWHLGIRQIQVVDFADPTEAAKRNLLAAFGVTLKHSDQEADLSTGGTSESKVSPNSIARQTTTLSHDHISLTGFEYFCYISQSKVEQLYVQIPAEEQSHTVNEQELNARLSDLVGRITAAREGGSGDLADLEEEYAWLQAVQRLTALSFGKQDADGTRRRDAGLKDLSSLVTKTRTVLRHILMHKSVRDLESAVRNKDTLDAFCYAYEGPHTFDDFARPGMAIISSQVCERTLRQYCSMKYFSDMDLQEGPDGKTEAHPHALNFPFFQKDGGIAYTMISFLFVTGIRDAVIFGSPICMILDSRKGIPL